MPLTTANSTTQVRLRWLPLRFTSALGVAGVLAVAALALLSPAPSTAHVSATLPPYGQWTTYANGDHVLALTWEGGDVLWAGTQAGGAVRWNVTTGDFVQFLKPQDPLAGNVVYAIAVDTLGRKWFGTDYGLTVLDDKATPGKDDDTWHSYTLANAAPHLPGRRVTAVAVDEDGAVWIGAHQRWDAATDGYVGGGITRLVAGSDVGSADDTWGPIHTLANTLTATTAGPVLGLASDNILDILPVPGDRVWIGTDLHWLFEQPDEMLPGRWVRTHGGLSLLQHGGTLAADDDTWQTWNCETNSRIGCIVPQLRLDANGTVWAAMRGRGVLTFDHTATTLDPDRNRFSTADGLPSNFVDAIAFGPAGDPDWANTVWLSTYHSFSGRGYGVAVLDHNGTLTNRSDDTWNQKNPTSGQPVTTADGLAEDRVRAMVVGHGAVWLGTGGVAGAAAGISPYDLARRSFDPALRTGAAGIPTNYITDIAFTSDGQTVWLATGHRLWRAYGAGALRFDRASDTWTQFTRESTDNDRTSPWTGLVGNNLTAVAATADGVWFGAREATWDHSQRSYTDGGLSVLAGGAWTGRTADNSALRSNSVSALAEGCQGELWVGLGSLQDNSGAGLDVVEVADAHAPGNDTWWDPFTLPALPSNLITGLAPDCRQQQMWAAAAPSSSSGMSQGGGLGRYDYASGTWTTYTTGDGLAAYASGGVAADVRSVAVGNPGDQPGIWAGTWGTGNTAPSDVAAWPYVPATVNWQTGGAWSAAVFDGEGWVSGLAVDGAGTTWVGASRGGMDADHDGQADTASARMLGALHFTTNGADWARLSPLDGLLPTGDVEVITAAPDGDVWIGTSGWGLLHFHPTGGAPPTATPTPTGPTPAPSVTPTPSATRPAGENPEHLFMPLVTRS